MRKLFLLLFLVTLLFVLIGNLEDGYASEKLDFIRVEKKNGRFYLFSESRGYFLSLGVNAFFRKWDNDLIKNVFENHPDLKSLYKSQLSLVEFCLSTYSYHRVFSGTSAFYSPVKPDSSGTNPYF